MEDMSRGGTVPVCVISPNFHVGDEEAELSVDAIILKTFDSLNFFEQLLVKCSAILGDQFLRDMLLYVMSATSPRKAALGCAHLTSPSHLTLVPQPSRNSSKSECSAAPKATSSREV
jgi:adenylate cyclase 10